jgi:hypothetical protein
MSEVQAELIETPAGESDAVIVTLPEGEVEAPNSDAVAIAEIEANKDITIAAIHADVEVAAIEARNEREEGNELWQAELRDQVQSLTAQVADLTTAVALLIPSPLSPEPEVLIVPEPEAETNLTPPSMKDETSETATEVIDVSAVEKPEVPEAPKRRLRFL